MTTIVGRDGGRRLPKEKKNQSNKTTNSVINNSNTSEGDHNHSNNKLKLDPKLQPTAEQIRIANLMNDRIDDIDLKEKIEQILELTGSSRDEAVVALHDCDNDTAKAIDMILEGYVESEWRSTGKKKKPPKTTTGQTIDENTKPDNNPNKESKIENRDGFKQAFNRSDKPSNRAGIRGSGPPRLQRAALANRGARKSKEFNNKNERNDSEQQNNDIFTASAQQSFRSSMDSSAPRRGDRRGRGRGGPGRGGNRGAFSSSSASGRGSRTFQNRGLQSNDGFPNSIDTWTNSTADQTQGKTAVSTDCNTMTVGNWSDIVANEDWSEEDCEPNHMETKVFTPSTKISEKDEMLDVRESHSSNISSSQPSNLSQFIGKPSGDSSQPTMSSILSASMSRPNVTGQSLLQQIQQSSSSQASSLNQYSLSQYTKQATESIKSLVGLSSSSNYNSANADLLSSNDRDLENQLSNSQTSNLSNKASRMKVTRSASKIPESAVEMPSNDSIAALGVHFGTLDFCSDNSQFSLGNDNSSVFQDSVSHVTKAKKPESNSLSTNSMLTQSTDNTYRPQTNPNLNDGINKGVSSSIIQNSVLGHQSLTSDSLIDRSSKSNINPYGQKVIDRTNKSTVDYSSVSPQQSVNVSDITSTYKTTTYSSDPTYNSVTASYPYSSNSQNMGYSNQVGNYSSNFSTLNNHSNTSAQKLRDIDSNSQQKQYDVSNAIVTNTGLGLISNSTVTTNVLKNTLSARKNVHSVPPPGVSATPVLQPSYLVGNTGLPIYPMGIPYDVQFQTTARDHNFATYGPQDVKYGRGSDADVIPVSSSQTGGASQTHNQTFVNTLPPGYGFFYAPGVNMMTAQGIYQTAPPIYPVAQPQTNAGSAGSAFAKANTSYGSHSYNSGYDSLSGVPQTQDYVKQSYPQSVQHNKGISGSNTSDLSTNSSIYNKTHSQINKSYDKQGFQGSNPPFNLTAGAQSANMSSAYGQPYVLPHSQQAMSLHHSLQTDVSQGSGPGVAGQRSISQTHKSSAAGTGNYAKYNWS